MITIGPVSLWGGLKVRHSIPLCSSTVPFYRAVGPYSKTVQRCFYDPGGQQRFGFWCFSLWVMFCSPHLNFWVKGLVVENDLKSRVDFRVCEGVPPFSVMRNWRSVSTQIKVCVCCCDETCYNGKLWDWLIWWLLWFNVIWAWQRLIRKVAFMSLHMQEKTGKNTLIHKELTKMGNLLNQILICSQIKVLRATLVPDHWWNIRNKPLCVD